MTKLIETEAGYVDWDTYSDSYLDDDDNDVDGPEYVKIDNLFVSPEFCGKGCAKAMMTLAIVQIKKDFPGLTIKIVPQPKDSETDLSRLASFYKSLGLEVVAV